MYLKSPSYSSPQTPRSSADAVAPRNAPFAPRGRGGAGSGLELRHRHGVERLVQPSTRGRRCFMGFTMGITMVKPPTWGFNYSTQPILKWYSIKLIYEWIDVILVVWCINNLKELLFFLVISPCSWDLTTIWYAFTDARWESANTS